MYMFRSNICMYVIKGFRWEKRGESQLRIHDVKLKICPDNKIYLNEPDEVLGLTCLKSSTTRRFIQYLRY